MKCWHHGEGTALTIPGSGVWFPMGPSMIIKILINKYWIKIWLRKLGYTKDNKGSKHTKAKKCSNSSLYVIHAEHMLIWITYLPYQTLSVHSDKATVLYNALLRPAHNQLVLLKLACLCLFSNNATVRREAQHLRINDTGAIESKEEYTSVKTSLEISLCFFV